MNKQYQNGYNPDNPFEINPPTGRVKSMAEVLEALPHNKGGLRELAQPGVMADLLGYTEAQKPPSPQKTSSSKD